MIWGHRPGRLARYSQVSVIVLITRLVLLIVTEIKAVSFQLVVTPLSRTSLYAQFAVADVTRRVQPPPLQLTQRQTSWCENRNDNCGRVRVIATRGYELGAGWYRNSAGKRSDVMVQQTITSHVAVCANRACDNKKQDQYGRSIANSMDNIR